MTDDFLDVTSSSKRDKGPASNDLVLKSRSDRQREAFKVPEVLSQSALGDGPNQISIGNLATMARGGQSFGFFKYDNEDSIRQRRTLDRLENLVTKMAGRTPRERSKHLKAFNNGESYETESFDIGDTSSMFITADYSSGRSYLVKDRLAKDTVGYRISLVGGSEILINNQDLDTENVINKVSAETKVYENETPEEYLERQKIEQADMFADADQFIIGMARQLNFDDICDKEFGLLEESPLLFKPTIRGTSTSIFNRVKAIKGAGTAALLFGMFFHVPFTSVHAEVGGIPMPFPVEAFNDINNGTDHKAQSLLSEVPNDAVSLLHGDLAPALSDRSLDAPSSWHGPDFWLLGGASNVHTLKPGVYAVEIDGGSVIEVFPSEILGKKEQFTTTIQAFTHDSSVAENVVARLSDDETRIIITADDDAGGTLYLAR